MNDVNILACVAAGPPYGHRFPGSKVVAAFVARKADSETQYDPDARPVMESTVRGFRRGAESKITGKSQRVTERTNERRLQRR
jgi:hypothetical protein